ncbi:hypothetical protein HNY73_005121 [Argiope bruennichi]|uniref:Uncharacterized protein n=1 Tax=Argiope bruennichi TaxID=94029 RepID=A0A8T0FI25_ARGBR|nr:hypothetical protein HNY73_005121 [Argiope bruennichi]
MIGRQTRPARHRLLIIFYLLCSVLALTPTIMAPPERQRSLPKGSMETVGGFPRGQPEAMQEMDNLFAHEEFVKKDLNFPNDALEGYPALLTYKTSHLLAEAEKMLQSVKNLKERRFVGAFIQRIKFLANILDQSVSDNNPEILEQNSTFERILEPVSTTPLDNAVVSPTPSELQESAVRETDQKQQGDKMTSKTSKFLPNTDYPASETSVTKLEMQPMLDKKSEEYEEDELVKELRNLHKIIASDILQKNITPQEAELASVEPSTTSEEVTSEAPPKRMSIMASNKLALEREKSRIKQNLAEEVAELQRLGEPEEEILSSLHLNNHRFHGSMHPMMFGQKLNAENLDHADNGKYFQNVQDVSANDAMISHIKPRIWRPRVVHLPYNPYKHVHMNNSFQRSPVNQQVLARKYQTHMANNPLRTNQQIYQDGIKNTIQKLQKQHQDFLMKNQISQMQKQAPQNLPNPEQNLSLGLYHPDAKHIYKPYPYFYNPQNLTAPEPQTMDNPFEPQVIASHKISSELSDEMKRQLRDGKVILLSDSVVRSNFGPDTEKNEAKNATEPKVQEAKKESKNEAQAPK